MYLAVARKQPEASEEGFPQVSSGTHQWLSLQLYQLFSRHRDKGFHVRQCSLTQKSVPSGKGHRLFPLAHPSQFHPPHLHGECAAHVRVKCTACCLCWSGSRCTWTMLAQRRWLELTACTGRALLHICNISTDSAGLSPKAFSLW